MVDVFYNSLIVCEEMGTNGIVIVIENLRWVDLIEIGDYANGQKVNKIIVDKDISNICNSTESDFKFNGNVFKNLSVFLLKISSLCKTVLVIFPPLSFTLFNIFHAQPFFFPRF